MSGLRILIIEDEVNLVEAEKQFLLAEGWSVNAVYDGRSGLREAQNEDAYDVIVMDRMLPGIEGTEITRLLRGRGITTPIIFVTALGDINDRIDGLAIGGDDYLPKPFSPKELVARIKAIARRKQTNAIADGKLKFGDLVFDVDDNVISSNDESINVTKKESAILALMMANPDKIHSKDEIIANVWKSSETTEENNVEAYISLIRKKLDALDTNVSIKTYRRQGYKLDIQE